jgi:hypothetical protein
VVLVIQGLDNCPLKPTGVVRKVSSGRICLDPSSSDKPHVLIKANRAFVIVRDHHQQPAGSAQMRLPLGRERRKAPHQERKARRSRIIKTVYAT